MNLPSTVAGLGTKHRRILICVVLLLILFIVLTLQITSPERSVKAYCVAYRHEKMRLSKLPGDTWPSSVFDDSVSDAGEFVASFEKLKRAAPKDIEPDVATLQSLYQKVRDDPSQAISASLSGIRPEENVTKWTEQHCSS